MKHLSIILLILALAVAFSVPAAAQASGLSKTLVLSKAYANSGADTSSTISNLGFYENVGVLFSATDSVSLKIYIDTRARGGTTWTLKDSTTIAGTSNTLNLSEWQLKGPTVDKVGSTTTEVRIRHAWASSANGVSSPKYTSVLWYR